MVKLSLVLVTYKMVSQIGNTIRSLCCPYQEQVRNEEVEILLVDNGSPVPLDEQIWSGGANLSYSYIPPFEARPSPAHAINRAVDSRRCSPHLCYD